jgi:manganese catalase
MYHHVKKLMYTLRVDEPDPRFGNMLLEQFGGANGELAATMQYSIQGLNCEDPDRKDLLMDIGTEELSHLEVVGCLARSRCGACHVDRVRSSLTDPRDSSPTSNQINPTAFVNVGVQTLNY